VQKEHGTAERMTEELDVIRQILDGDTESFRQLVDRYAGPVLRLIRNITGDSHTCEDIAQEVFLAAYTKLGTFDPDRSQFATWLFTIARNKSVNAAKRKKPLYLAEVPEQTEERSPQEAAAGDELLAALDAALLALAVNQRTAFVLAEFEKLPYETIAQIEGVRVGTVKSRVNRARNKLKDSLSRFEVDAS
jgi:RNA polymerase sigma-70 factor (ECF subfamily)